MAKTNVSVWDTLKTRFPRFGAEKRSVTVGPTPTGERLMDVLDFGVDVNNHTALKNTALYAGIRIISENIASLPKDVLDVSRDDPKAVRDHYAYKLISVRPNAYTNPFSFWSTIITWIKGWGNAYALIVRDSAGTPIELHQVHPAGVTVTMSGGKKWYRVTMGQSDLQYLNGTYPDYNILHFMELSLDGIEGVNPIIYNAAALGKSIATEKFAAEFYRKGGNIRAVMESDGSFDDDSFKAFMRHFRQSSNNYDTPLLEYGVKYKQLSVDPVAAQLVQSEILSIQDICRIINIPPHMVAELSHATFSNIEHQTIQFVQYSLRPIIKRIEVELESKLFDGSDRYDVKFVLDGLLRGDTAARSAYYHNAILDGYMTRNEVRRLEGLEAAEGLDKFLYPLNYGIEGQEQTNNE